MLRSFLHKFGVQISQPRAEIVLEARIFVPLKLWRHHLIDRSTDSELNKVDTSLLTHTARFEFKRIRESSTGNAIDLQTSTGLVR